ncbi:MFS transporter [Georgenia sp. Z1491]|uniref:MFS transporter n=1 Tax=Georgenia sp. Z1491 TaxID=3416707 RepID=UPI003CF6FE79
MRASDPTVDPIARAGSGSTAGSNSHPTDVEPPLPALGVPRYPLLLALYVSQYLGIGFLFYGTASILREMGASLDSLAVLSSLGMIWALKFLWAPLIDRVGPGWRGGHYRTWLLVLQPACAAVLVAMSFLTDIGEQYGIFVALTALYVAVSATQDIAVDALAVRLVRPHERESVNGIQVSGSFVGNILGGGLTAILYEVTGWQVALLTLAVCTLLPTLAVLALCEPAHRRPARPVPWSATWTLLRQPGATLWVFAAVPVTWGGLTAAYGVLNPALVDAGWSVGEIAAVLTMFGGIVAGLVSMGAGPILRRIGRLRSLVAVGALTALGVAGFLPVAGGWAPTAYVVVVVAVFFAAYAVGSIIVWTINMDYARAESPGTDFTAVSSFAMLVSFAGGAVALSLADTFGYVPVLATAGAVHVAGLVLLARHQRRFRTESLNAGAGPLAGAAGAAVVPSPHRPEVPSPSGR